MSTTIPYGTFTVVADNGGHRTIRLESASWANTQPQGTVAAKELDRNNQYQLFAFVRPTGTIIKTKGATNGALACLYALLTGNYEQMGLAYAKESDRCYVCNRPLTNPESLLTGIGPDCAERVTKTNHFAFNKEALKELDFQLEPVGTSGKFHQRPEPTTEAVVEVVEGKVMIGLQFADPRFQERKEACKKLRCRWDPSKTRWVFPWPLAVANAIATQDFLRGQGLPVPAEVEAMVIEAKAQEAAFTESKGAATPEQVVTQEEGPITIKGINPDLALRPFQEAGVLHAIKAGRTIIADEMGLGKTPQALAVAAHQDQWPVLVIPPASLKLNWKKEAKRWIPGVRVVVLAGKGGQLPPLSGKALVICNYDILGGYTPQQRKWSPGWGAELEKVSWGAIICDEAHYLKNEKAQRTKAVRQLMAKPIPVKLLLTGTPVLNRPIELWSPLQMLGYGDQRFGGFWNFAKRYCGAKQTGFGWDFSGATRTEELHELLISSGAMIRRRKPDVLKELPPKNMVPQAIQLNGHTAEYLKAEEDCVTWFHQLPARKAKMTQEAGEEWDQDVTIQAAISRQDYIDHYLYSKLQKSKATEQLVRWEALKLAAWRAKADGVKEWVDNFLESGKKLIIFAWHIEVVDELAALYQAPKIQGGMKVEDVEAAKERFQNDPSCKVIVCNLKAGGVGHTLTAASDVAFVEFPWAPGDLSQAVDRAHRIGQTESVTGWLLSAALDSDEPTIDDQLLQLLAKKQEIVDAVTDGKPLPFADFDVQEALEDAMEAKWARIMGEEV